LPEFAQKEPTTHRRSLNRSIKSKRLNLPSYSHPSPKRSLNLTGHWNGIAQQEQSWNRDSAIQNHPEKIYVPLGHEIGQARVYPGPKAVPSIGSLALRSIQPKLAVSQPGDRYEQEADRIAEEMTRMPEPGTVGSEQAQPSCIRLSCLKIKKEVSGQLDEEELLQTKPISGPSPVSSSSRISSPYVPAIVHEVLRSPGQPLDGATRAFMEPRLGYDFSQVRVHADRKAAESAIASNALAYTVGQNVVFGEGQYSPNTASGRRLLVHELTHVIQQRGPAQHLATRKEQNPYKQKVDNDKDRFLLRSGISALGSVRLQRNPLRQRSGQFVGESPSQNIREEVLDTMDRLHLLWSISNRDFNIEYPTVSALAAGSRVSPTLIPLTIAAIRRNEEPTLQCEVARHFLALTLLGNVGRGQPNNKSDIQRLQYVLRAQNNLNPADFASESSAVSSLSTTRVPDATIPRTLSALTEMKTAIAGGRIGWRAIHADEGEFGGDRFGGRTFEHGIFSIFMPRSVRSGANRVHVFFSPGDVQGESGLNAVLTHGLRGASDTSDWVLIGVPGREPGFVTIDTGQISDCLTHIGLSANIDSLRLSAHSRGYRGLRETIRGRLINTSIVDRVVILDANYRDIANVLSRSGIPASRVIAYNAGTGNLPLPGSRTISLPPLCMRAIGYSRLIRDAMVTRPSLVVPPSIRGQLLALPDRGCFTTGTANSGCQVNIIEFCRRNRSAVSTIIRQENNSANGLKQFLDRNDLVRFGRDSMGRQIQFDAGIYSHHFFVAEIAHEITN